MRLLLSMLTKTRTLASIDSAAVVVTVLLVIFAIASGAMVSGWLIMLLGGVVHHAFGWETALGFWQAVVLGILFGAVKGIYTLKVER